jgi:hypothetical protein
MTKTVTIEDVSYTLSTMTAGDGLAIQEEVAGADISDRQASINRTLRTVATSMGKTVDEVKALPWTHYLELIDVALEVNGMKAVASAGETQAGASPAA